MKINCDLGEGLDEVDALLIPLVDQANIACGAHAGDDASMHRCIRLAQKHHTEIGIHPSYPDRENFGRLSLKLPFDELAVSLRRQIRHFLSICSEEQARARYVKAHGALYNDLAKNPELLTLFMQVVAELSQHEEEDVAVMLSAQLREPRTFELAQKHKLKLLFEAFADRAYRDDGSLTPRSQNGAVFAEPAKIVTQYRELSERQGVTSFTGRWLPLNADTICVHGDNPAVPEAINLIKKLK